MSESYTFTWALNSAPDSIELESFSTSGTGWGSIKPLTCAEGTMSDSVSYVSWYIIGSKSTYRIRATKGSDTIYSDEFEVVWTGNEPSEHYNTLDCIEITTAPDTTAYTAGQKFDPAGMVKRNHQLHGRQHHQDGNAEDYGQSGNQFFQNYI